MTRKYLLWLPFALGIALFAAFYAGLSNPTDGIIASNMVGEELPAFEAGAALASQPGAAERGLHRWQAAPAQCVCELVRAMCAGDPDAVALEGAGRRYCRPRSA